MEQTNRESALEAILFALGEPVEEERLAQAWACTPQEAAEACQALPSGMCRPVPACGLLRMEHRWQMVSAPQYGERIQTLLARKKPDKLSPGGPGDPGPGGLLPAGDRGLPGPGPGWTVHSLALLLDRELVAPSGHLDAPGHPLLYKTTPAFLRVFGLTDLEDLPPLPEEQAQDGEGGTP